MAKQTSIHLESGLGLRGTNVFEYGFVGPQRSAGPIVGDLGKQTMFNGIPFGGARRIVADRDLQSMSVDQLLLQMVFPSAWANTIATPSIGQD
jgi:hypothetical protein